MRGKTARELRRSVTDSEAEVREDGTLDRSVSRKLTMNKEYVTGQTSKTTLGYLEEMEVEDGVKEMVRTGRESIMTGNLLLNNNEFARKYKALKRGK